MARKSKDAGREHRIDYEIVVDCYNETERHMGWWCYLEDRLMFPFSARCRRKLPESPLRPGELVMALGLHEEDDDMPSGIRVKVRWQGRTMAVPLEQLEGMNLDAAAEQAIADWHYWCNQGYGF